MAKISNEVKEMYRIFRDSGDFKHPDTDWKGMTGDYNEDILNFAEQYKEFKRAFKEARKSNVNE